MLALPSVSASPGSRLRSYAFPWLGMSFLFALLLLLMLCGGAEASCAECCLNRECSRAYRGESGVCCGLRGIPTMRRPYCCPHPASRCVPAGDSFRCELVSARARSRAAMPGGNSTLGGKYGRDIGGVGSDTGMQPLHLIWIFLLAAALVLCCCAVCRRFAQRPPSQSSAAAGAAGAVSAASSASGAGASAGGLELGHRLGEGPRQGRDMSSSSNARDSDDEDEVFRAAPYMGAPYSAGPYSAYMGGPYVASPYDERPYSSSSGSGSGYPYAFNEQHPPPPPQHAPPLPARSSAPAGGAHASASAFPPDASGFTLGSGLNHPTPSAANGGGSANGGGAQQVGPPPEAGFGAPLPPAGPPPAYYSAVGNGAVANGAVAGANAGSSGGASGNAARQGPPAVPPSYIGPPLSLSTINNDDNEGGKDKDKQESSEGVVSVSQQEMLRRYARRQ